MRIAIEAQRIFREDKHGMDFVALETIREIQKLDKVNEYFIFVSPGTDRCLEESENVHIIELKCPTYPLWEQIALPIAVRKVKADLLHCTSNTAPIFCTTPIILTLHDIIFLEKRNSKNTSWYQNMGRYYRRIIVPCIINKCRKIITVSNSEKERIKDSTKIDSSKIVTVYNGYNKRFSPSNIDRNIVDKYITDENYIFFLGNTDPKKNSPNTIKAYALYARTTEKPLPLVIADLKESVINEILLNENIEDIKTHIRCIGYINNSDLPSIYGASSIFLYTSLRESFGIPQLEAMACGTPVITSTISAIPEIAGDGAIMVDPTNAEAICNAIIRVLNDDEHRQNSIAYGLERVKLFSWEKTAEELISIYNSK